MVVENYKCPYCTKKLQWHSKLAAHLKTHVGSAFTCEVCKSRWNKKNKLKEHLAKSHGVYHDTICRVCGKGFGTKGQFAVHTEKWKHMQQA